MGVIETGMLEQVYVTKESTSYNNRVTAPASTDAVRALEAMLTIRHGRSPSPQKSGTPDDYQNLPARDQVAWDISSALWEPSGTLGTASYWGPIIKGGMVNQHVIASGLNTTIASGASSTGATLTSGTGLQVGDLVAVQVAGVLQVTRLLTVVGAAVTWDALTASPDVPGKVVAGVTYSLGSVIADSFTIAKFYNAANHQQAVSGALVDKLKFTFDGTKPVYAAFSGPAAQHYRSGTTKPGAFTTAGNPLNGAVGSFVRGSAVFLISMCEIEIANNIGLRNTEIGTSVASGFFRTANRKVTCKVSFYFDDATLLTDADAITKNEVRLLLGSTNGQMLAALLPSLEWEIPDIPKDNGPKILTATGVGLASAGNDSVYLAEM